MPNDVTDVFIRLEDYTYFYSYHVLFFVGRCRGFHSTKVWGFGGKYLKKKSYYTYIEVYRRI